MVTVEVFSLGCEPEPKSLYNQENADDGSDVSNVNDSGINASPATLLKGKYAGLGKPNVGWYHLSIES